VTDATVVAGSRQAVTVICGNRGAITLRPATQAPLLLEIGRMGPRGLPGTSGASGVFSFTQAAPAADWVISHGLGFAPAVRCEDSDGNDIIGAVSYRPDGTTVVSFNVPVAGTAHLS
jgi:hypothetical protein